jgi:hypothetical protein
MWRADGHVRHADQLEAVAAEVERLREERDRLYDVMEAQLVHERDGGELTEAAFHRLRHLLLIAQREALVSLPDREDAQQQEQGGKHE